VPIPLKTGTGCRVSGGQKYSLEGKRGGQKESAPVGFTEPNWRGPRTGGFGNRPSHKTAQQGSGGAFIFQRRVKWSSGRSEEWATEKGKWEGTAQGQADQNYQSTFLAKGNKNRGHQRRRRGPPQRAKKDSRVSGERVWAHRLEGGGKAPLEGVEFFLKIWGPDCGPPHL